MRAFLAARRVHIRAKLFRSRRASYFLLSSGLEREMAKGWVFALPAVFALTEDAAPGLVALLAVLAIPGVAYAVFAGAVGFRAYAEWSDILYDKHTKKTLPPEYQVTESATRARGKRRKS